jgi:hypothetical protein
MRVPGSVRGSPAAPRSTICVRPGLIVCGRYIRHEEVPQDVANPGPLGPVKSSSSEDRWSGRPNYQVLVI